MFCSNCGKQIEDNSSFCNYCGASTGTSAFNSQTQNEDMYSFAKIAVDTVLSSSIKAPRTKNVFTIIGLILSIIGVSGFFLIATIGLLIYGRIYLYDGYTYTGVLCTICIVLQSVGSLLIILGMITKRKWSANKRSLSVLSIVFLCLALISSLILICNAITNKPAKKSSSSSSSSSYSSSYEMSHSTYCLLYMKVSNVGVTHKGNYTYVSGTITNTGTYQIKYVKVKAVCKNYSGNIVDTDWTYAVDSSWLEPGESKKFDMMIKDPNNDIRKADVTVVCE